MIYELFKNLMNYDSNKKGENKDFQNYKEQKRIFNQPNSVKFFDFKIVEKQMKTSICKIKCNDGFGSGFFCMIPFPQKNNLRKALPALITNNHIIGKDTISKILNEKKKIVTLVNNSIYDINIDNSFKFLYLQKPYDATVIPLESNKHIPENIEFLKIDLNVFSKNFDEIYRNKDIYLLHFPNNIYPDFSNGVIKMINKDNYNIHHLCTTVSGSSGGPILNSKNYNVIGIHKGSGKEFNVGTFITKIVEEFNKLYNVENNYNMFLKSLPSFISSTEIKTEVRIIFNKNEYCSVFPGNTILKDVFDSVLMNYSSIVFSHYTFIYNGEAITRSTFEKYLDMSLSDLSEGDDSITIILNSFSDL